MKRKKAQLEKPSVGTVVGAKYRARCNDLSANKYGDDFTRQSSEHMDTCPKKASFFVLSVICLVKYVLSCS